MPVSGSRSGSGLTLGLRIRSDTQYHKQSQSKNKYWKKTETIQSKNSGNASGYVSRERGATIYPPNKNFVLEISIRREMNMEEITVKDDNMIKCEKDKKDYQLRTQKVGE